MNHSADKSLKFVKLLNFKVMIKIKSLDLVGIAVAAEIWFKKQNQISHTFEKELEAATKLKKELYKTMWDEDAELMIDELPF